MSPQEAGPPASLAGALKASLAPPRGEQGASDKSKDDARRLVPENEKCDRCATRQARFRVLDASDRESAVCCDACAPYFLPSFEDARGEVFSAHISDRPDSDAGP
jgi:hypothetical protein